jgi:plasmid stabilization system protein ParE
MKLQLTERAADEIEAIHAYLVARSPVGARNVQLALHRTMARLVEFPLLGRAQTLPNLRKIGVARYPYNVYYLVDEPAHEIIIVAVRHAARAPEFYDT